MKKNVLPFLLLIFFSCSLNAVSAQSNTGVQHFDDQVLINLSNQRTPRQTDFMLFVSKYNDVVNFAVPAGVLAGGIIGGDKGTRQDAAYIASSTVVNALLTITLKKLFKRPRPYAARVKINAVITASHHSFPSGHTSSAFTTATAISQIQRKWYFSAPAFIWAGTVGYSRMYLGVHYPTDIIAGAALGSASAMSMRFVKN